MKRPQAFQVAIVGTGPAGCLAALGVLKRDRTANVVLIDPDKHASRHRIGEALLTGTIYTLEEAGLTKAIAAAGFHQKIGAAYVWGKDRAPWYVNYPPAADYPREFTSDAGRHSIHVPRHVFDNLLYRQALERGAQHIQGRIVGVESVGRGPNAAINHITLEDGDTVTAQYWIDASGLGSVLGRRVTGRERIGLPRVGRYAYFQNVNWSMAHDHGFHINRTNIVSSQNGWFWVIHLGDAGQNLTSIGFITIPEVAKLLTIHNAAELFPEIAWFGFGRGLREARDAFGASANGWYVQPDYSFRSHDIDGRNWALAGDSAMFIDPILSQGVTLAAHYGFKRGQAAIAWLQGDTTQQRAVSDHYRNEGQILLEICSEWYNHNRSAGDWRLKAAVLGSTYHGVEMDPVDAFRWVTNLENVRHQYNAYPAAVQADIYRHLGCPPFAQDV